MVGTSNQSDPEMASDKIPFGELTVCHGKIHNFSWENPLFQWPFSIAMLVYQRVPQNQYNSCYLLIPLSKWLMPIDAQNFQVLAGSFWASGLLLGLAAQTLGRRSGESRALRSRCPASDGRGVEHVGPKRLVSEHDSNH